MCIKCTKESEMKIVAHPPFVHWEVTPECNHNCIHCYNYWRKNTENEFTGYQQFGTEHYMKIAKVICANKPHTVVITGGEPLLVFNKIKTPLLYMLENEINISINSNITLLTNEITEFVRQNKIGMFISFPSGNETTCDFITNRKGTLHRILKNLDILYENAIRFNLNIVASRINIEQIYETAKLLILRYSLKKIYITRVGKPINASEDFDQYLLNNTDIECLQDISVKLNDELGIEIDTGCPYTMCSINSQKSFNLFAYKKFCTAGKTSYSIDTIGNIKACPRDSKIYGNILSENFRKLWEKMEEWRNDSLLPEDCRICHKKKFCHGGCRVDAYPFTKKLNSMDTTAVTSNLPIKYDRQSENTKNFNLEEVFSVARFTVVNENFGNRLSTKRGYVYVTQKLKNFLVASSDFTVLEFMNFFSVSLSSASVALIRLLKNGIITKKEQRSFS